jgi:hypothetical protein
MSPPSLSTSSTTADRSSFWPSIFYPLREPSSSETLVELSRGQSFTLWRWDGARFLGFCLTNMRNDTFRTHLNLSHLFALIYSYFPSSEWHKSFYVCNPLHLFVTPWPAALRVATHPRSRLLRRLCHRPIPPVKTIFVNHSRNLRRMTVVLL